MKSEPAEKVEPIVKPEPVIEAEQLLTPKLVMKAEQVLKPESNVEAEQVVKPEAFIEAEPIVNSEPIEKKLVSQPSLAAKAETASDHIAKPESVADSAKSNEQFQADWNLPGNFLVGNITFLN